MHYRDDLSYKEIGEQLAISPNMVKKYIVKGLAACRQGMARYE
jgi:RNA polymerase sigma-70 factor (ECF subfamily)